MKLPVKIKNAYRIIIITLILCIFPTSIGLGETPVISLGSWGLGDSSEIRYGQDNFKTYTYNEVQSLYNTNCIDSKNSDIYLENNYIQSQQYTLQLDSINESITKYKQLAEQYRSLAQTYEDEINESTGIQRDTAEQNMQQSLLTAESYELQSADAVGQKAEIYVQRENCLFIFNNTTTYRNQQLISQISDFRNSIYEIKLLDEKYDEQGTFAEYAKLQADAQSINKSKDMSFQTDVDFFSADFDYYTNQQELVKQQINNSFEKLLSQSNLSISLGTVINIDNRSLRNLALRSYSTVESDCYANDIKKRQLENKLRIIEGKISILKEYCTDNSNQVRLAQNEKTLATLELSKWHIQRKDTLQNAYAIYKSKYNEVGINEKKAKAQYEKYIMLLNKYNFGLTNRITVKQAELNHMQSSLAAWNALYEYANALGRIENCMSGSIE